MRKAIIVALSAFAALAFAKPALSMPSVPSIEQGQTNGVVLDVGYRHHNWHGRQHYRGYAYGYRPHYRHYGYYRPYAYYGYPYYYRRPGISLWFGF
jgi:hypothetical protein